MTEKEKYCSASLPGNSPQDEGACYTGVIVPCDKRSRDDFSFKSHSNSLRLRQPCVEHAMLLLTDELDSGRDFSVYTTAV